MEYMPNAIVKNVLACLVLVILCIVIGAEVAESKEVSVGIIAALVGGSFMLWLGARCWVLVFIVPPVMALLPLPGKLGTIPVSYLVGLVVLVYWFIMWGMGYVRFRWRSLLALDFAVAALFLYMVISYIRNPVSMAVFGWETDYVGGKEYVFCILAVLFYIAMSCIPCSHEQVVRVLRWCVRLCIITCFVTIGMALSGYVGAATDLHEAATGGRFSMFLLLGMYGIYILYGQYPMSRVLLSPGIFVGCVLSCIAILLSGWREQMLASAIITIALAHIKRELWCLTLIFLAIYGALLYLSKEEMLDDWPYGIQRCISILPGVEVSDKVEANAGHSSEWRVEMWKWAVDPRTGYIRDYVWGDGFGISVDFMRRETTAMMRQGAGYNLREQFAVTGVWHNGGITTVHRLGFVGLGLVTLVFVTNVWVILRVCHALRGTPMYLPSLFLILPYVAQPVVFYVSAGTLIKFFNDFVYIAMAKFFYCEAREQGLLMPLFCRQHYIPLAIQAHEERIRPAEP